MPVAACVEEVNELEVAVAEPSVGELLRERMEAFDEAVGASNVIEIDGITPSGNLKVINHDSKDAYEVEVDTIVKTPLDFLIGALVSGIFIRVYGVSRIVGYFSRVHNWNKSKLSELRDRRVGNYWESRRTNTERVGLLGESIKIFNGNGLSKNVITIK